MGSQATISTAFSSLNKKMRELELSADDLTHSRTISQLKSLTSLRRAVKFALKLIVVISTVFLSCFGVIYHYHWPIHRRTMFYYLQGITQQDISLYSCFLPLDGITLNTIRPPLYCDFCRNVTHIDRVKHMTPELFLERYAYTGRPLIVEGYQKLIDENGEKLDFDYFKNMYPHNSPSLLHKHKLCEFQAKVGGFASLGDLFNMSLARRNTHDENEKWYAGWINCDRAITEKYSKVFKPHFLPPSAAFSRTFWTFMGSPKLGYTMHIDPVWHPQWHTQIVGRKKWYVEPPSECYFQCHDTMEVIMEPGDVIIFHNGMWYHETENIGDTLSIGVAAEFD